jgi:hypothetical protein
VLETDLTSRLRGGSGRLVAVAAGLQRAPRKTVRNTSTTAYGERSRRERLKVNRMVVDRRAIVAES